MIFYNDFFVPSRFAAITVGFVILIRPKYKDDVGLLEHEKTHVRQFFRHFMFLYSFRYTFIKSWRLKYEAEAYQEQLKWSKDKAKDFQLFASFLVEKYRLNISHDQACIALATPQTK